MAQQTELDGAAMTGLESVNRGSNPRRGANSNPLVNKDIG